MNDSKGILTKGHDDEAHSHGSGYLQLLRAKVKVGQLAQAGGTARSVAAQVVSELPEALAPALSTNQARNIVYSRHRAHSRFKTLNHRPLPGDWFDASEDDPYIYRHLNNDYTSSDGECMVITCEKLRRCLQAAKHWAADGTFYVTPRGPWRQVVIISAFCEGRRVACAFVLLTRATRQAYAAMFRQFFGAAVESIMLDFEDAFRLGFRLVFPDAEVNTCDYHLTQNFKRRARNGADAVASQPYRSLYSDSPDYRRLTRMCAALAFLPPDLVRAGFSSIYQDLVLNGGDDEPGSYRRLGMEFLHYVEENYIGTSNHGVDVPGRFPIGLWNLSDRAERELALSNSGAESGNARIRVLLGKSPTLSRFFQHLSEDELKVQGTILREINAGNRPPAPHGILKWQNYHANVRQLIAQVKNQENNGISVWQFLSRMAGQMLIVNDVDAATPAGEPVN